MQVVALHFQLSSNANEVIMILLDLFIQKLHKHKNANKRISDFFLFRCFLSAFFNFCSFVAFCAFAWLRLCAFGAFDAFDAFGACKIFS